MKSTNSLPTKKQRRIVKLKIKGKSNKDIGDIEYPNANDVSKRQLVSRELHKSHVAQYHEQSKLIALKENNITWNRIIKPINDALDADKQDGSIDHTTRLSASRQAKDLLEKGISEEAKEQLLEIGNNATELEIIRLIKNR
jgi:hypothetical protein